MTLSFFTLSAAGPSLEALLAWRLLKCRAIQRYPYFSAYIFWDATSNLVLLAAAGLHHERFGYLYWVAEVMSIFTGFLIIWEVARGLFPVGSALRRVAQSVLLGIGAFVLPAIWALGWSQANLIHFSYRYVPPVFVQYLCLAQAVLLLALAAVALYYGLPLGRNLRGLVLGFGFYLSLSAVNFASLQIVHGFLPYWQLLSPALYIALLIFWIWAFWEYSPSPAPVITDLNHAYRKEQWNHLWVATTSVMKRDSN
ncbi:MAG: hypothetical protein ACRD4R_14865 [Candidatus Acidiferrales bacterium]